MSAICRGCGSSMRTDDVFCGVCGRAADRPVVTPAPPVSGSAPVPDIAEPAPDISTATSSPRPAPEPAPIADTTDSSTSAAGTATVAITQIPARAMPCLPETSLVDMTVPDTLDPLSNSRYFRQLRRHFALYAGVAALVNFVVFLLDLLITLTSGSLGILGFFPVFAILSLIVVLVLFWLVPVPAMINEWHRLITFRAPAAAATLTFIQRALDGHHIPYDSLTCLRFARSSCASAGRSRTTPGAETTSIRHSATSRRRRRSPPYTPARWKESISR